VVSAETELPQRLITLCEPVLSDDPVLADAAAVPHAGPLGG